MSANAVRLFYGVELSAEVKGALTQLQSDIKYAGVTAGNWSEPELFHVTLLFLGSVAAEHRRTLGCIGSDVAAAHHPFQLAVTRPGMFERNRILWMGMADDAGMEALRNLHREIRSQVARAVPITLEDRPYRAHLTLARKLEPSSFPQVRTWTKPMPHTDADGQLPWWVDAFCLFASTRVDGRLRYPVQERFPLSRATPTPALPAE